MSRSNADIAGLVTKFFTACSLIILPFLAYAEYESKPVSKDWEVGVWIDDFDDKKTCAVRTTEYPLITFFVSHADLPPYVQMSVRPSIGGIGIRYRIDKKEPVLIGHKYHFQTEADYYWPKDVEMEQIITDFRKGNNLVYEVTSSNQFVANRRAKISLQGFTKAYNLAKKMCQ